MNKTLKSILNAIRHATIGYTEEEEEEINRRNNEMWLEIKASLPPRPPQPDPTPKPSGAYGTAGIATPQKLHMAGLTGASWGDGVRIGYDETGCVARYLGENSLITIGPPGTGKFTDIIAPAMIEYGANIERGKPGGSCVIVDQKGEISAVTIQQRRKLGEVKILCPFNEGLPPGLRELLGPTETYNPMQVLLNPKSEAFALTCDALAQTIIPDDASGDDSFFTDQARNLVSGIMMHLMLHYPKKEQNLAKVCSIVCARQTVAFSIQAALTGNQYIIDRLAAFAEAKADDKAINSILLTAEKALKFLSNEPIGKVVSGNSAWCFDDLKRRPITVFLILPAKFIDTCSQWFRIVVGGALTELKATPKGRVPVLFLLDEFAQMGRVPIFETAFADGRGYGIKLWPFVQNVPQLIKLYGRDGWQNFLSGAQIQMYLPPREMVTAEHVSKESGRRTIVTTHRGTSYNSRQGDHMGPSSGSSTSYGEQGQAVFDPTQVMNMGRNKCLVFARGMVDDVIEMRRRFYFEDFEIKVLCGPNPYHEPLTPPQKSAPVSPPKDPRLWSKYYQDMPPPPPPKNA